MLAAAAVGALAAPQAAGAHPHVFAEARLEVMVDGEGNVESLRHVWRFDDLFSSTVLFEFDMNRDLELDNEELDMVGSVIHESLADFDYFQFVKKNGRDVPMNAPERIIANFSDQQLTIAFESKPAEPMKLDGNADFGVYDPTFYTAIDFFEDDMMMVTDIPEGCARSVVRPDPDEAIAMNQESLTEAFFNEPGGVDYSQLFATRLELDCTARG
jgi:ABC-type uncharacterized transport system substrate-binding protein